VAVKLRLVRMGKKKQPTYRVVAADSRSPRDGRFLEVVGTYAPRGRSSTEDETIITIDHEKALRWLRQGAKPTERVARLLQTSGTLDRLTGSTGEVVAATEASTAGAADVEEVQDVHDAAAAVESAGAATGSASVNS
jgi:small subunit ribosomal protein S16